MTQQFQFAFNTEELVETLLGTGVTIYDSGFVRKIRADDNDMVLIQIDEDAGRQRFHVKGEDLLRAFNKFTHKMSFTVTNGELEDLDLDADLADTICQTAIFGEVLYA